MKASGYFVFFTAAFCATVHLVCSDDDQDVNVVYHITVKTCEAFGAGTDADVFIQIFGKGGQTEEYELTKSSNSFESGSTDEFHVLAKYVGLIEKIGIKRNTKGLFDAWKLCEVLVDNIVNPIHQRFAFNEWIPANKWVYSHGGK